MLRFSMDGILVWANSYCRSTLAFYDGIGKAFNCPLKIIVLEGLPKARMQTGFRSTEFAGVDITEYKNINTDHTFEKYKSFYHIFGSYQSTKSIELINFCIGKGIRFGICSEAPCNMSPYPMRIFKQVYIRFVLPIKVRNVVKNADFIINYSGNNINDLTRIGWDKSKVISCGYYSPPIEGSKPIHRSHKHWKNFSILLSGIHQWHRSPMLLLKALHELDKRGVKYECNITQEGPLFKEMQNYVDKHLMKNVHLLGFLPITDLISQYENCSVYIGAGNNEPWGMRLNDALLCGAPLIINRGMGGSMLVDKYKCGLTFNKNDYQGLANALETMITNYDFYQKCADAAYKTSYIITPQNMACKVVDEIKNII